MSALQDGALRIGIAGAGVLGRLLAWQLAHAGHRVTVIDPAPGPLPAHEGRDAAGFTSAGMLSPLAELDSGEPDIAARGWYGLPRWADIQAHLLHHQPGPPRFARTGSLLVAHGPDLGSARRTLARLTALGADDANHGSPTLPQPLDAAVLHELEPDLHSSLGPLHAWLLPGEGHLDPIATLQALHQDAPAVQWVWGQQVARLQAGALHSAEQVHGPFDWVIDARGHGAQGDLAVRGVRGETVCLHAPGLQLRRPVRLLHPRHRVYIVPRAGDQVLIGASEIESEDRSPVSLRSAVELMAAAYSIVPALAEARIVRLDRNLRPALPDNRPHLHAEPGLLRINGLYRHGWLLAPSLVDEALTHMGVRLHPPASSASPGTRAASSVCPPSVCPP